MVAALAKPSSNGKDDEAQVFITTTEHPAGENVRAKIDEVGILSYISFGWIFEYLWKAYKGKAPSTRSWPCSIFDAANVNATRLEHLWTQELRARPASPSLFRVIVQFMSQRLAIACFIFLFCLVFGFIGPTCLVRGLVSYTETPPIDTATGEVNYWNGVYLVFGILIVEISRVLMYGATWAISYRTGIRVRGAVLSLLYKSLLHSKSLGKKTSAEIVNICANDGQRLFDAVTFAPLVLVGPFVIVGGIIYLLKVIGAWSLLGLLVFVVFDILQVILGITMVRCRRAAIANTEERMSLMGEILHNIRLIKANVWEDLFSKRVKEIRDKEKSNLQRAGYAQSLAIVSGTVVPVIATLVTVLAVVHSGHDMLASDAFSAITVYFVMLFGIRMIPYGARYLGEAYAAIRKIQALLMLDKFEPNLAIESQSASALTITNATFAWTSGTDINEAAAKDAKKQVTKPRAEEEAPMVADANANAANDSICLNEINLSIARREKIGVYGAVGAGKTALLNSILGTTTCKRGTISVSGSVAYASQRPCVMSGTVRDNILFGQPMHSQRYERAIHCAQLTDDLARLPSNELSEVGEAGAALSGGQRARVALARCFFNNRDIYLFDDVLSAVNADVADLIFNEALFELLVNKTVVIVTANPKYLAKCDRVIFMLDGDASAIGKHDSLMAENEDYKKLFMSTATPTNAEDTKRKEDDNKASSLANGAAKQNGVAKTGTAFAKDELIDDEEDLGMSAISKDVYLEYIEAAGGYVVFGLIVLLFIANVASNIFSVFWLSKWMKDVHGAPVVSTFGTPNTTATNTLANNEHLNYYAGVYIASVALLFFTGLFKAVAFVKLCIKASTNLHNRMLTSVLHGVVSFFDVTPTGRILNRFSKDLDEIDVKLPFSCEALLQYMITCIGFILTIIWVFPLFILPCLPLGAIFIVFFLCFRAGIRSLKRVENVSRSPVFNHVSVTLDGLSTVHAFGQHQRQLELFRARLDDNSSAMFLFNAAMRWQAVWLDLLVVAVTFIVSILIVSLSHSIAPSDAGMALAFALQMSGVFQFAVRSQTELESKLTAVERVRHYYKNVDQEDHSQPSVAAVDWPKTGELSFNDVTLRYRRDGAAALDQVSFNVHDGEHVAIVGRTGAGKSSLTNALFRLHPLEAGTVSVDGCDISRIGLKRLRRAMALVPQDSGLFCGTLRFNLDPVGEHDDDRLWDALERVNLKQFVSSTHKKLDLPVESDGKNLSVGQRQLVIIARTLLRDVRLLALDEATAAIDVRSDGDIQRVVKKAFADRTVLIVSHRAETVADLSKRIFVHDGHVRVEGERGEQAAPLDGAATAEEGEATARSEEATTALAKDMPSIAITPAVDESAADAADSPSAETPADNAAQ